ncbi:uncharacterized [Tachysurus ichikawai]
MLPHALHGPEEEADGRWTSSWTFCPKSTQFSVCLMSSISFFFHQAQKHLIQKAVSLRLKSGKTDQRPSLIPSRPIGCLCLPDQAFRGRSSRAHALSGASVQKNTSSFSFLTLSHI